MKVILRKQNQYSCEMKNQILTTPFFSDNLPEEIYPENYEPRLPIVFLLDVSSSMRGVGINELNRGLKTFEDFFIKDNMALARLETAIVTFGTTVRVVREFLPLGNPPFPELRAGGRTLMFKGIETAATLLSLRKDWYKKVGLQYYRPYIIMITDGSPWPDKNTVAISQMIENAKNNRSFIFQAFGTGNANMDILSRISSLEFPPQSIQGYSFENFFKWLIPSISTLIGSSTDAAQLLLPAKKPFAIEI